MDEEEINNHILGCENSRCKRCRMLFIDYFMEDVNKRTIYRYQQTEKFKNYRRRYYQRCREEILRKYHEKKKLGY